MEKFKDEGQVVPIADARRRQRAVPPLSDTEILRLRKLLEDSEAIMAICPVARRLTKGR